MSACGLLFFCFVHHSASMESDMHELNSGSIVTRVSPLAAQTSPHGCRAEDGVPFPRWWRRAGVAEPVSTVHLAHLPLWRIPAGSARQLLSCWSRKNVIQARPFLALPGVQPGVWIASDPRGMWQRPRTSPFSPDHFITFVQGLFLERPVVAARFLLCLDAPPQAIPKNVCTCGPRH